MGDRPFVFLHENKVYVKDMWQAGAKRANDRRGKGTAVVPRTLSLINWNAFWARGERPVLLPGEQQ